MSGPRQQYIVPGKKKAKLENGSVRVRAYAFSEDTHLLLTGGMDKILRIFDMNRPDAHPKEVANSPGSIRTVDWLHSDNIILSSCTDTGGVRLWDIISDKIVKILETKSPVTSAEVSQDGRYITTTDGSSVKFLDANNFGLLKSYDMPCNVESASLEPKHGNTFIVGGEDMWVHRFDFQTGEEIGCNKGHHGPVHCVRYAQGGESYTSGSEDGTDTSGSGVIKEILLMDYHMFIVPQFRCNWANTANGVKEEDESVYVRDDCEGLLVVD